MESILNEEKIDMPRINSQRIHLQGARLKAEQCKVKPIHDGVCISSIDILSLLNMSNEICVRIRISSNRFRKYYDSRFL